MSVGGSDRVLAIQVLSAKEHLQVAIANWATELVGLLDLFDGTRDNRLIEETILVLMDEVGPHWAAVRTRAEMIVRNRVVGPPQAACPLLDDDDDWSLAPASAAEMAEWEHFYGRDD